MRISRQLVSLALVATIIVLGSQLALPIGEGAPGPAKPIVLRVKSDLGSCTGFVVSSRQTASGAWRNLLLTAGHCLDSKVTVDDILALPVAFSTGRRNGGQDYAVFSYETPQAVPVAQVRREPLLRWEGGVGEPLYVWGYGRGAEKPWGSSGWYLGEDPDGFIVFSAKGEFGFSGSPVFDGSGRVVGIFVEAVAVPCKGLPCPRELGAPSYAVPVGRALDATRETWSLGR